MLVLGCQVRLVQVRAGQDRVGQVRAGQVRVGFQVAPPVAMRATEYV